MTAMVETDSVRPLRYASSVNPYHFRGWGVQEDETLHTLEEYRRELVAGKRQAIDKYDSAVLLVAAAFLTFSVNFLKANTALATFTLVAGWVLLALAIVSSLASNLASWWSFSYVAREVARACCDLREGKSLQATIDYAKGTKAIIALNMVTAICLVLGIVSVIVSAYPTS